MSTPEIVEDPLVDPVEADSSTAEFLAAANCGEFLILRSPSGRALEPLARVCPDTGSVELVPELASGGAELVSWTVSGAPDGTPVVLAIGQLDEGPWWWARIADLDPTDAGVLTAGRRMRIVFRRPVGGGQAVPIFVLDESSLVLP